MGKWLARAHAIAAQAVPAADGVQSDPAADARRRRVIAMLAGNPGIRYAVATDNTAEAEAVILALGIRGLATGELLIPRANYDPLKLMQQMDEYAKCGAFC